MKYFLKIFLFLILVNFVSGCRFGVSSPSIDVTNQSDNYINKININWNGYDLGTNNYAKSPGYGGSQNFYLKKKSDLFGPVHIEWENALGQKIVREFVFTKEQLPYFQNNQKPTKKFGRTTFDIIYFFLTQDDMKMLIDPNGMGSEEIKKERQISNKFSDDFIKICPKQYGCKLTTKLGNNSKSNQLF